MVNLFKYLALNERGFSIEIAVAWHILPVVGGIGFEPTTFPMSTECSKPSELTTPNDACKTRLEPVKG
ncbi:protein of unknown function [Cardinium endosymbiont cEper1 of Encarsia pergandiella]|nr:protein of unknown function [Cardinium endosymbiont cEper1 of Encarsia pergandiella]